MSKHVKICPLNKKEIDVQICKKCIHCFLIITEHLVSCKKEELTDEKQRTD